MIDTTKRADIDEKNKTIFRQFQNGIEPTRFDRVLQMMSFLGRPSALSLVLYKNLNY